MIELVILLIVVNLILLIITLELDDELRGISND